VSLLIPPDSEESNGTWCLLLTSLFLAAFSINFSDGFDVKGKDGAGATHL